MKLNPGLRLLLCALVLFASQLLHAADKAAPPPVYTAQTPAAPPATPGAAPSPAVAEPAPPPAAPAKRSAADLEKLVAPIALYPDPLLATILPASVYPLEIVQAARFMADTNNLSKLDAQPWDASVKAVARVPDAIKKLNDEISWTIELGEAFLAQDKDLMDAIQAMRGKAQKAGTLQTSPQQVVVVTNMVVEKTVEQQVVVVTNTVVQIQPSSSTTVYVPTYNPATVYYPPPAYYANPYPLMTFGAGMAMGAIIANNCNWSHGGCYHGGDVDIDIDKNVNRTTTREGGRSGTAGSTSASQKKWQPDQSRLSKSGSPTAATSARNSEARGWGSGGAKPSTGAVGARPSPSTGAARPSPSAGAARPSPTPSAQTRPTPSASRSSPSPAASRPSPSPSAGGASSARSSSGQSAFAGGGSGASTRQSSSRGSASRGGGGGRSGGGRGR